MRTIRSGELPRHAVLAREIVKHARRCRACRSAINKGEGWCGEGEPLAREFLETSPKERPS